MIIATAGHVDHGKTTLVKALTGVDTDRLDEEKRRGMTIDLGFAYADIGGGAAGAAPAEGLTEGLVEGLAERLAFVDVPGHERFVRNLLAGVAGLDLALLVVAADDGPMPQTREHLAILGLLGVPQLVVVLSKVDRVAPERLAEAGREITALLASGPYAQAPVFAVAAHVGTGLAALRQHLAETARRLVARSCAGNFRLAVDRSFSLVGAGRIVTGVVLSGMLRVGETVIVSPAGTLARVRSLHAQNQPAETAHAGQRCALNLVGPDLKRAEPVRGDWVVGAAAHAPADRLDVQLSVLASASAALNQRAVWQLHLGAAAVNARLAALDASSLAPGSSGLAQLLLDRPLAAAHGDRFILRDAAANRTLAGGWVIDPFGPARGRSRPARLDQLAALALADPALALSALLTPASDGVALAPFARSRNLRPDEAQRLQQDLALRLIPTEAGPLGLSPAHWQAWRERVLGALDRWHAEQPDSLGAQAPALRQALGLTAGASQGQARAVLQAVLAALVDEGALVREGLRHRRAGHRAALAEADRELLARAGVLLQAAGLRPPIVGELATQLGLALPALLDFLGRMASHGRLVRVAPNRYYLPQTVAELAAQALALAAERADGAIDAAAYRDRTGIGRNLTVQVLEFLDREGLTRFDGTRHRPAC
jgi:selenocysteine-specific elongation factor